MISLAQFSFSQFASLQPAAQWLIHNGYWLMFIIMILEGPVITAAGAFAAALGFFNIWIVFVLSVLGNFLPDIFFYALGFWGRIGLVDKFGHYLGVNKTNLRRLETMLAKHAVKSIIIIKLVPFLAAPGLLAAGMMRMNIKKYVTWTLAITIPSSLVYLIIGYYFGTFYSRIAHYAKIGAIIIAAFIIFFFAFLYFEKKLFAKVADKMEK